MILLITVDLSAKLEADEPDQYKLENLIEKLDYWQYEIQNKVNRKTKNMIKRVNIKCMKLEIMFIYVT